MTQADPGRTVELVRALLPQEIASSLKPVWSRSLTDPQITAYKLSVAVGPTALKQAKDLLAQSLTPMSGNECLNLLTELKAMTRPTPGTTDDVEVQLTAYLKKLMEWPADVVRKVLTTQSDLSPWWPSWAELKDRLHLYGHKRKLMLEAISLNVPHS